MNKCKKDFLKELKSGLDLQILGLFFLKFMELAGLSSVHYYKNKLCAIKKIAKDEIILFYKTILLFYFYKKSSDDVFNQIHFYRLVYDEFLFL